MEIYRQYTFSAAHRLPNTPPDHKCHNMHGHNFTIVVLVMGPVDPLSGRVCDFSEIDAAVNPLVKCLDHSVLNNHAGLENPTSENVCVWFWEALHPLFRGRLVLGAIEVKEGNRSGCVYRGVR